MRFACNCTMVLAVVILGAFAAGNASATVTLHLKSPLEGGRLLEVGNYVEGESSGGATVESTGGNLQCSGGAWAGLYGKVKTNSKPTDILTITGSKRAFDGGSCTGSFPIGGEALNYWTGGGGELGSISLSTSAKALFKSSHTSLAKLELVSHETGHFCDYGLKKLKGAASFGPGLGVSAAFTKQPLPLVGHNMATCPKTVSISVVFGFKTAALGSPEEESLAAFNPVEGIAS
jgi:hypothetical protein